MDSCSGGTAGLLGGLWLLDRWGGLLMSGPSVGNLSGCGKLAETNATSKSERQLEWMLVWLTSVTLISKNGCLRFTLEEEAAGENQAVIIGVIVGDGGLKAEASGEAGTGFGFLRVESELTSHYPRGKEGLNLAVVRAAVPGGGVDLEFGPEIFAEVILGGCIAGDGAASCGRIAGRKSAAEIGDDVEPAEAFASRKSRINAGVGCSVFVAAGGERSDNEGGQQVIPMLLIRREDAVLA